MTLWMQPMTQNTLTKQASSLSIPQSSTKTIVGKMSFQCRLRNLNAIKKDQAAERANSPLKEDFSANNAMVKEHSKVPEHLMFG